MSPIAKRTTMEHPGTDTDTDTDTDAESSPFERHTNELLTHWIEVEGPEDFTEFVEKLPKTAWFCEIAEA